MSLTSCACPASLYLIPEGARICGTEAFRPPHFFSDMNPVDWSRFQFRVEYSDSLVHFEGQFQLLNHEVAKGLRL